MPPDDSSDDGGYQLLQLLREQAGAQEAGRHMGSMCPSESSALNSEPPSLLRQQVGVLTAQLRQLSGAVLQSAGDSGLTEVAFSYRGGWSLGVLHPCLLAVSGMR